MALGRTIPALPVRDVEVAAAFYAERLGFATAHLDPGSFAIARRDAADVHLWQASDERWATRRRGGIPVRSGAESFLAGTASCRIEAEGVDALYAEFSRAKVLHPTDRGSAVDTDWGTREFAVLDLDGNLLTFFERRLES